MALEDDIAILARAPLLNLMEQGALRLIAFAAEHRVLRRGETLFKKGDRSDGGYVVTNGLIVVEGEQGVPPFLAEPGALIGQTALFARTTRAATATAREPSGVLRISPTLMRRVLEEFPTSAQAIHGALAIELSTLSGGLERVRKRLGAIEGSRPRRSSA